METPETVSSKQPFTWTVKSRADWQALMTHRRNARLYLFLSWGPYALSAGAVGIGFTGHDSDHQAWILGGALVFCLFAAALPFYVPICLREWWDERKEVLERRKSFWQSYREDPFSLDPPPDEKGPRAPWE